MTSYRSRGTTTKGINYIDSQLTKGRFISRSRIGHTSYLTRANPSAETYKMISTKTENAIKARRSWDEGNWQTQSARPPGSVAVLLEWSGLVDVTEKPPRFLRLGIIECCLQDRSVAFWIPPEHSEPTRVIVLKRDGMPRLIQLARRMFGRRTPDIAIAKSTDDAVELFEHGWDLQMQKAIFFDDTQLDHSVIKDLFADDGRQMQLPNGAALQLTAAVDGDGIVIAAHNAADLVQMLEALARIGARTGFRIEFPDNMSP